ncbi:MAG TPA: GlsB/YeaQ/YmgE family stress response membrane protein [Thermomicrobiales bacterium]|nr:GlsB/YeaQ/YmgE family stress response membrane protein [Thermomicrobiales bacterium]
MGGARLPNRLAAGASAGGALIAGIVGGIIGGWVLDLLGAGSNLNWLGSLVVAILGAVAILYAVRKMQTGR